MPTWSLSLVSGQLNVPCTGVVLLRTVLTAGGWSASIIPEAHQAVETTAGTVLFVDIPEDRQDLRKKFHPDNFPVWSVRSGSGDQWVFSPF